MTTVTELNALTERAFKALDGLLLEKDAEDAINMPPALPLTRQETDFLDDQPSSFDFSFLKDTVQDFHPPSTNSISLNLSKDQSKPCILTGNILSKGDPFTFQSGSLFGDDKKTNIFSGSFLKEKQNEGNALDIEAEPTNITFKPIVSLSEIEDHKTGQENDKITFEE